MSDDLDTRRRRALYRAAHRGTKEMDILLGRFADTHLPAFSDATLEQFERLLAVADPTLQGWIFATGNEGASEFQTLIQDIRAFHGLETQTGAAR